KNIEPNDSMLICSEFDNGSSSSQKLQSNPLQFKINSSVNDKDKNNCGSSVSSSSSSSSGVAVQQGQSSNTYIKDKRDRRIRPIRKARTRMGVSTLTGASSNARQSSNSLQGDLDDLSLGGSFTNVDYSEISSNRERSDDNNI